MFDDFLKAGGILDSGVSLICTMFSSPRIEEVNKAQITFSELYEEQLREAFERHCALWCDGATISEEQKELSVRSFYSHLPEKWLTSLKSLSEKIANRELALGTRPILSTEALLTGAMQLVAKNTKATSTKANPPVVRAVESAQRPAPWYIDLMANSPENSYQALVDFAIRSARSFESNGIDLDLIASESVDKVISYQQQPRNLRGLLRTVMFNRCVDAKNKLPPVLTTVGSEYLRNSRECSVISEYDEDSEPQNAGDRDTWEVCLSALNWVKGILRGIQGIDRYLIVAIAVDKLKPREAVQNVFHVCGAAAVSTIKPSHRVQSAREKFEAKLKLYLSRENHDD
jgi:hypothetical protein